MLSGVFALFIFQLKTLMSIQFVMLSVRLSTVRQICILSSTLSCSGTSLERFSYDIVVVSSIWDPAVLISSHLLTSSWRLRLENDQFQLSTSFQYEGPKFYCTGWKDKKPVLNKYVNQWKVGSHGTVHLTRIRLSWEENTDTFRGSGGTLLRKRIWH